MGYIELPADVVLHAAIALKSRIICLREERIEKLIDQVMSRKKPSRLALFFEAHRPNIQTADNRTDALEIAKKTSRHMFDTPYHDASHYAETTYDKCDTLITSANTVLKQVDPQGTMLIDLYTADMLAKYFP